MNGDDRARTGNPRLAKAVLSQLSYVPVYFLALPTICERPLFFQLGALGLEPRTSALSGLRSNQTELCARETFNFQPILRFGHGFGLFEASSDNLRVPGSVHPVFIGRWLTRLLAERGFSNNDSWLSSDPARFCQEF